MTQRLRRGLTLIELLIVVAIISILAGLALPNFLDAQTRAKVSRVKSGMRTAAFGLEAFYVDNNTYPRFGLAELLRPVKYIETVPVDVFNARTIPEDPTYVPQDIRYGSMPLLEPNRYVIASVGPDTDIDEYFVTLSGLVRENSALQLYPGYSTELFHGPGALTAGLLVVRYFVYDPTNGTTSVGDVFRFSDR